MKKGLLVLFYAFISLVFVFAAQAVPSVTVKLAPETEGSKISQNWDINEEIEDQLAFGSNFSKKIVALVVDKTDMPKDYAYVQDVIFETQLTVTSLAEKNTLETSKRENLEKAYEDVLETKNLSQLAPELWKEYKLRDSEKYTATQLFELSVDQVYVDYCKENYGGYIRVTFDLDLTREDPDPIFMHKDPEKGWIVVDPQHVVRNMDGSVTVDFKSLCPVLILQTNEKADPPYSLIVTLLTKFFNYLKTK